MHNTLLFVTVKWLKSVYIFGSYRKIKTGVQLFLEHPVGKWRHLVITPHAPVGNSVFRNVLRISVKRRTSKGRFHTKLDPNYNHDPDTNPNPSLNPDLNRNPNPNPNIQMS